MKISIDVSVSLNGTTHDPVGQTGPVPVTVYPTAYALCYPVTDWDDVWHPLRVTAVGPVQTRSGKPHKTLVGRAIVGLDQVPPSTRARLADAAQALRDSLAADGASEA